MIEPESDRRFRDAERALLGQRWTLDQASALAHLLWCGIDFGVGPDMGVEVTVDGRGRLIDWRKLSREGSNE